ncbi:unnamed protein product [Polarella glacialis]|uniref:Uncharacterized protein n=1 Tax=Polarella glacialis TaxID=89957 RepID=A0A813LQW9_POLGL|nr:unnamed protein product [Polarella glacialis]
MLESQLRPGDVVSVSHGCSHGAGTTSGCTPSHAGSPDPLHYTRYHQAGAVLPRSKVSKLGADVNRTCQQLAKQNDDIYCFDFDEHAVHSFLTHRCLNGLDAI